MRPSPPWTSLLLTAALAGCAARSPPQPSAPSSSTRGTTVVRMAFVTAVRELPASGEQTSGTGQKMTTITELTVRFDDGKIHTVNIEPGELFRPGERVIVTSRNGNTYITHD